MTLEEIVSRFQGARLTPRGEWEMKCSAHDDRRASLGIRYGDNGGIVMCCQAGCANADILAAVGLTLRDLAPVTTNGAHQPETVYRYDDEQGEPLFEVVKTADKRFWQRLPGGEKGKIKRRSLYRMPDLLRAPPDAPIFIVEGEKDADNLWRHHLPATTNPMGAGKWLNEYTSWLQARMPERRFVILPDNDEPGKKHAEEVLRSLKSAGLTAEIRELPGLPTKGDVTDWLEKGGSAEELAEVVDEPPEIHPLTISVVTGGRLTTMNLPVPDPLVPNVMYKGFSTLIAGDSKLGKSSLILRMMLAMAAGGWWLDRERRPENQLPASRVLFINFEDPLFLTRDRALAMMAPDGIPENFLTMPVPYGYSLNQILAWLAEAVADLKIDALVLDPIAIAAEWEKEDDNAKVALTFKALQRLAAECEVAVLSAHHTTKKPGDYGGNIRGASAIKANVIAWFVLEREKELIRLHGINKLTGRWDVVLDREEKDWSWWMVESRSGTTRNPQQLAKEESKSDLYAVIAQVPGKDTEHLADICDLPHQTCRRYLLELEQAKVIFSHEMPRPEGQGGRAKLGWFVSPSEGEDDGN